MTLQDFLSSATGSEPDDWQATRDVLTNAGFHEVVANFEREPRLGAKVWAAVFTVLPQVDHTAIVTRTRGVFRKHLPAGPFTKTTPEPKGRALSGNRFRSAAKRLKVSGALVLPTKDDVDQYLIDLEAGIVTVDEVTRLFANWSLGSYIIWATFDEGTPGGDPFQDWATDAEQVRKKLGLISPPDDPAFVLAVYTLPADVETHYPTLAEACASDPWNKLFRCSNPGDAWGYTSGGRPEVVHKEVLGRQLTVPPAAPGVLPLRLVS